MIYMYMYNWQYMYKCSLWAVCTYTCTCTTESTCTSGLCELFVHVQITCTCTCTTDSTCTSGLCELFVHIHVHVQLTVHVQVGFVSYLYMYKWSLWAICTCTYTCNKMCKYVRNYCNKLLFDSNEIWYL